MSITEDAIKTVKESNYSQSVLLQAKFDRLKNELYGKPIG